MKSFILIDQSIKDAGGHHLEYALRVLKAAKQLGYRAVLATNKRCGAIQSEHIDVVDHAFAHIFWENDRWEHYQGAFLGLNAQELRFLKTAKATVAQVFYRLMHRPLGLAYSLAAQGLPFSAIRRRYGVTTSDKRLSSCAILAGYEWWRIHQAYQKSCQRFRALQWLRRFALLALAGLFGLVLSPILLPYLIFRNVRQFFHTADNHVAQFAHDLRHMLDRVGTCDGDIVFIPTLGNVELMGTGLCIENFAPARQLSWHFLFRRNLFQGREPSYQRQIARQVKTLKSFAQFKAHLKECMPDKAHFYTDTAALTAQYNQLAVFPFKTLPIPLDASLNRAEHGRDRFNIVYIGDARDEKGFPLLPKLVADLGAAGYAAADLRFIFQSNFNVPSGESNSLIARQALSMESAELVSMVEGPFASDAYLSLINNADIILLPYNSDAYYARSSGIYAEALAAGIPVVARDQSWMSQEMLRINQAYYAQLLQAGEILQSVRFDDVPQRAELLLRTPATQDDAFLLIEVQQLCENPGHFLNIRWQSSPAWNPQADRHANFYRHFTVDLRVSPAYALLCLPRQDQVTLEFAMDDGSGTPSITIRELALPADTPLFQVGALFCNDEDFATAVIEVLAYHEHYVNHGRAHKQSWAAFHNAEVLVRMLDGTLP
jgi:glycosyltransferase involved in cell wall biosynthesis